MTFASRVEELIQWEAFVTLLVGAMVAWLVVVAFSTKWNDSRRVLLRDLLKGVAASCLMGATSWGAWFALRRLGADAAATGAIGFIVAVSWATTLLQVARVWLFEWLFLNSTREGVPRLLVDLFTLLVGLIVYGALLHVVFLVEVTSLLATSAVASVVLGLALQDTLGQLFAGISLQLNRPFRIGDWIEVKAGSDRTIGQVLEISWRATTLVAIGEELITLPNKLVAQGVVSNFSGRERPFVRSYLFRFPLNAPVEVAKAALREAAERTPGIVDQPAPLPLIVETTESWVAIKVITFLSNFGAQFVIGDAFHTLALQLLAERGLVLANAQLQLVGRSATEPVGASQARLAAADPSMKG